MPTTTIGRAPVVRRWTPTWPSRKARYFDFSQWGGGYLRADNNGPGAIVLDRSCGILADIQTGRVYTDDRFIIA